MAELSIGIIGGLISSMIIGFSVLVYNKIIFPQIQEMMFAKGGTEFTGEWESVIEDKDTTGNKTIREMHLSLKQQGFKIKGTFTINNRFHDDKKILSNYVVEGMVSNNFITAFYVPQSRKRSGAGTLLLQNTEGGTILKGINTGIGVKTELPKARLELEFNRLA